MADIELVIKIDEEIYETLRKNYVILGWYRSGKTVISNIHSAVAKGKPLPKGHGRLIDMKNLQNFVSQYTEHDAVQLILADREDYIPTIIEADTENEVERE